MSQPEAATDAGDRLYIRHLTWLEVIHTAVAIAVAIGLLVSCLLLHQSNRRLEAVHAQLEIRNEQGREAVSLLRQANAMRAAP